MALLALPECLLVAKQLDALRVTKDHRPHALQVTLLQISVEQVLLPLMQQPGLANNSSRTATHAQALLHTEFAMSLDGGCCPMIEALCARTPPCFSDPWRMGSANH